jgi:hypothetical protein
MLVNETALFHGLGFIPIRKLGDCGAPDATKEVTSEFRPANFWATWNLGSREPAEQQAMKSSIVETRRCLFDNMYLWWGWNPTTPTLRLLLVDEKAPY